MAFLRVRDASTGHEYSVDETAVFDGMTVVDKPAVNENGHPLPAKYRVGRSTSDTPTESWSKAKLTEFADAHGVDLGDASTKADILAAIEQEN